MKKSTIIFSTANLVGLLLFLFFTASIVNLAKDEQRDFYDGIDGVTFFCTAVPVLLVCLLLNVCWTIKALIDIFRRHDYQASIALGVVAGGWLVSFLIVKFVL